MWNLFEKEKWHEAISNHEEISYFHDESWAQHLQFLGWKICRWNYIQNNESVSYLQGFLKNYSNIFGILWFPDWIIGDYKFGKNTAEKIRKDLGLKFLYIRFRSTKHFSAELYVDILKQGWDVPSTNLNTGLTMILNLSQSIEEIKNKLSSNWKRNLKRSNKHPTHIRQVYDPLIIIQAYNELQKYKSLKKSELFSDKEIKSLIKSFADDIYVFAVFDNDNNITAIRGCITHAKVGYDIFAATSELGRKTYASHELFLFLINHCKEMGCFYYDLNGIDPSKNMGVYNFKQGTGAKPKKQLGEFDWSNNTIFKNLVQFLIKYK